MRRLIVLPALAPILLGLSACGGPEKDPNGPTPPDVAANFSQPIDARGTEPAWGLKIRGTQLALDRPGQPARPLLQNVPTAYGQGQIVMRVCG